MVRGRLKREAVRLAGRLGALVEGRRHREECGPGYRCERETARRDALTGLGTRSVISEEGAGVLRAAVRRGEVAAVIVFDLDDFKWVNDTFGHAAGDEVLRTFGARVRTVLRDADLAVRLGGDEFAVVLAGLPSTAALDAVAERLRHSLVAGIALGEATIHVQVSMGAAVLGVDGKTLPELLDAADTAAYEVKRGAHRRWHQGDRRVVARQVQDQSPSVEELEKVLEEGHLLVHLQPQVGAATGDVVGFEALARWEHPRLGLLQPRDIIPLAERGGLTRRLTLAVVENALAAHEAMRLELADCRIAVNVSTRGLFDNRLLEEMAVLLAAHRNPAPALTVEITEPAVTPSAPVARALEELQSLGCRISLHEYGTGQTSLTSVAANVAVRELKVAPELAGEVVADPDARRLVRAVVSMAHSLDLDVVGEGVESAVLADVLRELGCDVLQGFHIQPPAPLDQTLAWARAWPGVRTRSLGMDDCSPP